jgi:hypothetical protein
MLSIVPTVGGTGIGGRLRSSASGQREKSSAVSVGIVLAMVWMLSVRLVELSGWIAEVVMAWTAWPV